MDRSDTKTGMKLKFSERGRRMKPSAIRQMTKLAAAAGRDLITLAGGMPNPATFPLQQLSEIASEEIRNGQGRNLQYGMTAGASTLVRWVCEYLSSKQITASPENVVLTTGSQQALDLIVEILLDPTDFLFIEVPTYVGALAVFEKSGARIVSVHQDSDGVVVDDLEEKLKTVPASATKLIYVISNFQNPSGISLSSDRRTKIADMLEKHNAFLIEDDPYGEISFQKHLKTANSIKSHCPDRVMYLGTFSKLVAPTFRTGWVVAVPELARKIELAKEAADLCGSLLDQKILFRYCSSSDFPDHLNQLRSFYKERYLAMENALQKHMPSEVSWTHPTGGFFIWVTLPESLDAESFLEESILEKKVSYVIGRPFTWDGSGMNCLRLAYSVEDPARIEEGVSRLAGIIRSRM